VLDVIELHDDAYNLWRRARRSGDWGRANREAAALIERLGDELPLFRSFYRADNETGDKTQAPRAWFEDICDRA
jgi:hypothetical protein